MRIQLQLNIFFLCCLSLFAFWSLAPAQEQTGNIETQLYTVTPGKNSTLELVPKIHLIPPGSTLVHKDIHFEAMGDLEPPNIEESARKDIQFFQSKLQDNIQGTIQVKDAVFDVYQDMTGKHYTDPLLIIFTQQDQS